MSSVVKGLRCGLRMLKHTENDFTGCVAEGRCDCVVKSLRELAEKTSYSFCFTSSALKVVLGLHFGTSFCHNTYKWVQYTSPQ